MNSVGQTICLSMIVKNEATVIRRCLDSVRSLIDHWVIVDTGSTDGTQDIIRDYMKDVPGELVERPWQDFAHNRSEALTLARPYCDYTFIIDADDALELPAGFEMPALMADSYMVDIRDSNAVYQRQQFVRSALPWRYAGVLHEFLTCDGAGPHGHLPIIMRRNHDGARRNDPTTYQRDVEILERALAGETDAFLISRYTFYLAQSYRDSQQPEKALEHYLARGKMGYWHEEAFMALLHAARIKESLGHPEQEVIDTYLRAAEKAPTRVEALHGASRFCRYKGRNEEGYQIAKRGADLAMPTAGLFIEPWIYETGLLDELAVNAYWSGHPRESLDATLRILGNKRLPQDQWQRFSDNARFALQKLPKEPNLGSLGAESFEAQHVLQPPRPLRSVVQGSPRVLVAILAKQKEAALPLYLDCLEALDYPKSSMVLYIRTNNNTDQTEQLLREWVARVGHLYAWVEFDASDVADRVQEFGAHEWNATRFRVLGQIRDVSLRKTAQYGCDFYFAADVDNFIRPCTLQELVALNLPIVAPFLRFCEPGDFYSNYHGEVDVNGYYKECDQYHWALSRLVRGLIEMPVVHCTYLIRADVLPELSYQNGTGHYEYVVFSNCARNNNITQYLDNRQIYGYITFDEPHQIQLARELLLNQPEPTHCDTIPESNQSSSFEHSLSKSPMYVINLDRSADRLSQFHERNMHMTGIMRSPAVDGSRVDRSSLLKSGYIDKTLTYSPGALGCALSHIHLWELCIRENKVITVFEDDVIISHKFIELSDKILSDLAGNWDIIQWGCLLNPLYAWCDLGGTNVRLHSYGIQRHQEENFLSEFQANSKPTSVVRLLHSFGTQGYSISPAGAKAAIDFCLPLSKRILTYPDAGVTLADVGVDIALSGVYPSIRAFLSLPSLVIESPGVSARLAVDKINQETAEALTLTNQYLKNITPRIIHFVLFVDKNTHVHEISLIHYVAMQSALIVNKDYEVFLYTNVEPSGTLWDLLSEKIRLEICDAPDNVFGVEIERIQHKVDVMRLQILMRHGGVYLDLDTICLRPFDSLLNGHPTLGREGEYGLCNAVIIAPVGAEFLIKWLDAYRNFHNSQWNEFSVFIPKKLSIEFPDLVSIEPESSFFRPSYNKDSLCDLFERLRNFPDAYIYHLWASASKNYISDLTFDRIMTQDTTYNIAARAIIIASQK